MDKIAELKDVSTRLERVFSDWLQFPTYVVGISETGLLPCRNGGFIGLSSPFLHRWFREDIKDRFTGAGPAILLDDVYFAQAYDQTPAGREDTVTHFVSVVAHEMGHAVNEPLMFAPDEFIPTTTSENQHYKSRVQAEPTVIVDPSPRYGHGPDWIRSVLHIGHRLQAAGFPIRWPMAINHHSYGISPAIYYFRHLQEEPTRLASVPLRKLREYPTPERFLDQWSDDCERCPDSEI